MISYYKVEHKYKLINHFEKKHIGIYSSMQKAEIAIKNLQGKTGFKNTPDGFKIKKVLRLRKCKLLDNTFWIDGYDTYTY